MDIKYCKKCHNKKRIKSYQNTCLEIKDNLEVNLEDIKETCISYCGFGKDDFFIEIDDHIIEASNYEEFLEKIRSYKCN
ncbi:MAG: hypothetical protein ACK5HS_03685 [Mycoplasmatales bacterium]